MSDQGKANYEGYYASIPGSKPVPFDELPHLERLHWDAGACCVEAWLADAPVDEDMPGSEPQPARVIVVTEVPTGDRAPVERRYAAEAEDGSDYGYLNLLRDGRRIARYQPSAWLSVRDEGALIPDRTARKLGLAMQAIQEIAATVLEADDPRRVQVRIARDALEYIADVDL